MHAYIYFSLARSHTERRTRRFLAALHLQSQSSSQLRHPKCRPFEIRNV